MILLAAIVLGFRGSLAGDYRGAITLHSVDPNPQIRKKLETVLASARAISISLTLKPKGDYVLRRTKGSVFSAETSEGRWTRLDGQLILMPAKVNGKPAVRASQILVSRRDKWVLKLPQAGDLRGEVVFAKIS